MGHKVRCRHAAQGAEQAAEAGVCVCVCGQRTGGRRSVPGKEVGSGCKLEVHQRRTLLMGGSRREGNKNDPERG